MSESVEQGIKGRTVEMALDKIVPYWRNPRRISSEAVEAIAESLRQYEYQQPIVVDAENVIIIGHTRYAAMRKMGITHAEVLVAEDLSQQAVKQLRVIDNRAGEYTSWDYDALRVELDELSLESIVKFFPEVAPHVPQPMDDAFLYGEEDDDENPAKDDNLVEFVCPGCFHSWEQKVTAGHIMAGLIKRD